MPATFACGDAGVEAGVAGGGSEGDSGRECVDIECQCEDFVVHPRQRLNLFTGDRCGSGLAREVELIGNLQSPRYCGVGDSGLVDRERLGMGFSYNLIYNVVHAAGWC